VRNCPLNPFGQLVVLPAEQAGGPSLWVLRPAVCPCLPGGLCGPGRSGGRDRAPFELPRHVSASGFALSLPHIAFQGSRKGIFETGRHIPLLQFKVQTKNEAKGLVMMGANYEGGGQHENSSNNGDKNRQRRLRARYPHITWHG